MFKSLLILYYIFTLVYSLICQSNIIKNNANYSIVFEYDYINKLIKNTYNNPINIIEYYDYNTNIKYKLNDIICENYYFNNPFPIIKKLNTDILIDSYGNIELYKRNNDYIINYTIINNFITEIYYNDSSYQKLYNCVVNEFIKPDLTKCNQTICNINTNIIFLVEESEYITEYEYEIIKDYINKTINEFQYSKIGIITYSNNYRIISNLTNNKNDLKILINNMYQQKGKSFISYGLNEATNILKENDKIILINTGFTEKDNNKLLVNCKDPCDNINVKIENCENFCEGKCYNNTCYIKNKTSNLYKIYIKDNKCLINNKILNNDCCINGPDLCCCDLTDNINNENNKYNINILKDSLNNMKNKKINLINININRNNELYNNKFKLINDYSIKYFNIQTIKEIYNINLSYNICKLSKILSECYKDCYGFCGFNKYCYCPECIINNNNYCINYKCENNTYFSNGCIKEEKICENNNKCYTMTKDINNPLCCIQNSINCKSDNNCINAKCYSNYGCKYINKECYNYNSCLYSTCSNVNGCKLLQKSNCNDNKKCISLDSINYTCINNNCETNLSCGNDDLCGSWYCNNGNCEYISNCKPNKCQYLEYCAIENNNAKCYYKDKEYFNVNKCMNCVCNINTGNFDCNLKTCENNNPCQYGICDDNTGECIYYNRTYNIEDKCNNYTCVPDYNKHTYSWIKINKCINYPCKNTLCNINGECIYEDILCINYTDKCFIYSCENNTCIKKILHMSIINNECLKEYHNLGLYLNYNISSYKTYKLEIDIIDDITVSIGYYKYINIVLYLLMIFLIIN